MSFFRKRDDGQITSLEILAIALGVSTFGDEIAGRRLIVFSDNKGAESATQKGDTSYPFVYYTATCMCCAGVARQFDQSCIVHSIWLRVAVLRTAMWVTRVASKDNIADDPSRHSWTSVGHEQVCFELCFLCREYYGLLTRMKAVRVPGVLHASFLDPAGWESLSILGIVS
jgi:hypothetical protein